MQKKEIETLMQKAIQTAFDAGYRECQEWMSGKDFSDTSEIYKAKYLAEEKLREAIFPELTPKQKIILTVLKELEKIT